MLQHKRFEHKNSSYVPRTPHFLSFAPSYKHALYIIAAITVALLTLEGPIFYLVNQNFEIFKSMALTHSPQLLVHLEREQTWINVLILTCTLTIVGINFLMAVRLISRFNGPTFAIQNHLNKLIHGDWTSPSPVIRENDEFKELVLQYDYFFKTILILNQNEINSLEKLIIDPNNRESYAIWTQLLDAKKVRLGYEVVSRQNVLSSVSLPLRRKIS
jgi:hypothetical protein